MNNVCVIGATGMPGKPVVRELVNAGYNVTALVRDVEKAKQVLPTEVKLVQGDLFNTTDVAKALQGNDILYLNLSVKQNEKETERHTESDGVKIILEEAHRANIKLVSYLSSLVQRYQGMNGFQWWAFDVKQEAIRLIKSSGIPYVIFYPSAFMETLDQGGYRRGNALNLAGVAKERMWFVAGVDYAKQVTQAFKQFNGESREYAVQGTEPYTATEAVDVFLKHYDKRKLTLRKAPIGALKFLGHFNTGMNYGYHIVTALNNYPERFESEQTWRELGKPEITLARYAKQLAV